MCGANEFPFSTTESKNPHFEKEMITEWIPIFRKECSAKNISTDGFSLVGNNNQAFLIFNKNFRNIQGAELNSYRGGRYLQF
jgi:hypothetical protein